MNASVTSIPKLSQFSAVGQRARQFSLRLESSFKIVTEGGVYAIQFLYDFFKLMQTLWAELYATEKGFCLKKTLRSRVYEIGMAFFALIASFLPVLKVLLKRGYIHIKNIRHATFQGVISLVLALYWGVKTFEIAHNLATESESMITCEQDSQSSQKLKWKGYIERVNLFSNFVYMASFGIQLLTVISGGAALSVSINILTTASLIAALASAFLEFYNEIEE